MLFQLLSERYRTLRISESNGIHQFILDVLYCAHEVLLLVGGL